MFVKVTSFGEHPTLDEKLEIMKYEDKYALIHVAGINETCLQMQNEVKKILDTYKGVVTITFSMQEV
jgi:hypothetical protein